MTKSSPAKSVCVVFMTAPAKLQPAVTNLTNQAQTPISVTTATLAGNEAVFQIMYDVFELRLEFEARAGLDAGFGLCFVCLLS
jgi:hypothetical protein